MGKSCLAFRDFSSLRTQSKRKKASWATSSRRVGWNFRPALPAKYECADHGCFSSQSFWNHVFNFLFHSCHGIRLVYVYIAYVKNQLDADGVLAYIFQSAWPGRRHLGANDEIQKEQEQTEAQTRRHSFHSFLSLRDCQPKSDLPICPRLSRRPELTLCKDAQERST